MGGLSVGISRALNAATKRTIREHWTHVEELTGQAFDYAFFEREDFVYDTDVACRAVVAARMLRPESALMMLQALHAGFYRENRDITRDAVVIDVAYEVGFERDTFAEVLRSKEAALATFRDYELTQTSGIKGFPSLLVRDESGKMISITTGYQPFDSIEPAIAFWLDTSASA